MNQQLRLTPIFGNSTFSTARAILAFGAHRQYDARFWRGQRMDRDNRLTGKKTTLAFGSYSLKSGMDRSVFDPDALSRLR